MEKIDYKKQLKHLYKPSASKVELMEVPKMNFLMVDGEGDPNKAKSFSDAIEALYPVSYTLKFMGGPVKKEAERRGLHFEVRIRFGHCERSEAIPI